MSSFDCKTNAAEKHRYFVAHSSSMEDLSEYTDAEESVSAPTEILAEFLSSIMMKNYENALKYCTLILNYEPNNTTAKEFYPLIMEKIKMIQNKDLEDSLSESSDNCSITSSNTLSSDESYSSENENKENADSEETTTSYSSIEDLGESVCNGVDSIHIQSADEENGNSGEQEKVYDSSNLNITTETNTRRDNKTRELIQTKIKEFKIASTSMPYSLPHSTITAKFENGKKPLKIVQTKSYLK